MVSKKQIFSTQFSFVLKRCRRIEIVLIHAKCSPTIRNLQKLACVIKTFSKLFEFIRRTNICEPCEVCVECNLCSRSPLHLQLIDGKAISTQAHSYSAIGVLDIVGAQLRLHILLHCRLRIIIIPMLLLFCLHFKRRRNKKWLFAYITTKLFILKHKLCIIILSRHIF